MNLNFDLIIYHLSEAIKSAEGEYLRSLRLKLIRAITLRENLKHEATKQRLIKSYLSKEFRN